MPDIADGEQVEIQGSSRYILRNQGGVYSCTCPAWQFQGMGIQARTCKHLRNYRGADEEDQRVSQAGALVAPRATGSSGTAAVKKDTAPAILLAHKWEGDVDLTGWWMSEKLDGLRAYWTGEAFVSRNGNCFVAPDWFVKGLPADTHLDGELWAGRKQFQKATSIVRRTDGSDLWKELSYMIFDAPQQGGVFEERVDYIKSMLAQSKAPYAKAHEHVRCEGIPHLRAELARVEALGGEGLMMRQPKSKYVTSRSTTLLKVKTFYDAEARVLQHLPGKGKHKGRLGGFLCELPDGTKFQVGTGFSDAEREAPADVGSVITFRYQELTDGGVPRFPSYVGVREDLDWPPPEGGAKPPVVAAPAKVKAAPVAVKVEEEEDPEPNAPKDWVTSVPRGGGAKAKPVAAPVAARAPMKPVKLKKAPAPAAATQGMTFRLELHKSWEIEVDGARQIIRYGVIGGEQTEKIIEFPDAGAALRDAKRRMREKIDKGFEEV
jgi:DNA ligase 1